MSVFVSFSSSGNLAPVAHVVGHDEQDRREGGQRNEARERRRDEQHDEQRERVNHPGDRRSRAGSDVRGRARDRARGRQPAEQRRRDVRDPLRDQLDVRVVPIAAHPVGDDRRHQRFHRAEERDGERRPEEARHQLDAKLRDGERRPAARDAAKAGPDRLDRRPKTGDRRRAAERARRCTRARAARGGST